MTANNGGKPGLADGALDTGIRSPTLRDITLGKDIGVNVGAIEKELAALWRSASTDKSVTRACSWNLVVHCEGSADGSDDAFDETKKVVDRAVRHVPSRTLFLKSRPYMATDRATIEAWVSANCQVAPGGGKLLCTEEITIETHGKEGAEHLPSLIRALLVPDVPTALLWAGAPPTDTSAVRILLSGVDRLLFDTALLPSEGGLAKLAHVGGLLDGLMLTDLNWLRTGSVRSVLSSLFDPPTGPEPLSRLRRVRIDAVRHGVPAAKLLAGWLASRLAWGAPERMAPGQLGWHVPVRQGSLRLDIEVTEAKPGASVEPGRDSGIRAIELLTDRGDRFSLADKPTGLFEACSPGLEPRVLQAHEPSFDQLLVASLGSRGRDRLYGVALHRAVELDR